MEQIIEFLKGKKAYIAGVLMIALGILTDNHQLILEGLGVLTLRAGISKIAN